MSFDRQRILPSQLTLRRQLAARHVTDFCANETGFREGNRGNEGRRFCPGTGGAKKVRTVKTQSLVAPFSPFPSVEWTSEYDFKALFAKLKSVGFNGPIRVEGVKVGATAGETTPKARSNREFLEKSTEDEALMEGAKRSPRRLPMFPKFTPKPGSAINEP